MSNRGGFTLLCLLGASLVMAAVARLRGHSPWRHALAPWGGLLGILHSLSLLQNTRPSQRFFAEQRFLRRFGDFIGRRPDIEAEELHADSARLKQDRCLTVAHALTASAAVLIVCLQLAHLRAASGYAQLSWLYLPTYPCARGVQRLPHSGATAGLLFVGSLMLGVVVVLPLGFFGLCYGCPGNIGGP